MPFSKVMKITSEKGAIEGDLDEGKIGLVAVSHSLTSSQGKRRHNPLAIVKSIDKSTVPLYQALINNQTLKSVHISFLKDGEEFFTIDLENARVVFLNQVKETFGQSAALKLGEYEEVGFAYGKIRWTFTDGGIEMEDEAESS